MSNWTITINILCVKCKQNITERDINQNNYQLILLPVLTIQHQVCPRTQPNYSECGFTYTKTLPENNLNLNINLN